MDAVFQAYKNVFLNPSVLEEICFSKYFIFKRYSILKYLLKFREKLENSLINYKSNFSPL